jgi:hypothetical protein
MQSDRGASGVVEIRGFVHESLTAQAMTVGVRRVGFEHHDAKGAFV